MTLIKEQRHPIQKLEEALLRDPADQSLIEEAIEWTDGFLGDESYLLVIAKVAATAWLQNPKQVRGLLNWELTNGFSSPESDADVDWWMDFINEYGPERIRRVCLPPEVHLAYSVLLACCRVRLAICSQDMAEAIGQAVNVGIEYGQLHTQLVFGAEVARDRATDRKRTLGSRRGAEAMKARSLERRTEEGTRYQADVEDLMARNKRGITWARRKVAGDLSVPVSRVKSLTVDPSKKTGSKA